MTERDEPPDRIKQLRQAREEHRQAAARIRADIGISPKLRDRNRFFHSLLNGARNDYDRIRPKWREYRQHLREADRVAAEIETAVRQVVMGESGYRALAAEVGRESEIVRMCVPLLRSIRTARKQIDRVNSSPRAESGRTTVDRDTTEASRRLRAVRLEADNLRAKLAGRRSLSTGDLSGLDIGFSGTASPKERIRRYKRAKSSLDSVEKGVQSLIRDATRQGSAARAKQSQYLRDGKARYRRDLD